MYKNILTAFLMLLSVISVSGQSFGIRAGLNYSKLKGPSESGVNESYGITNGFHFGLNYAYKLDDRFSIKAELLYSQVGTNYKYSGESFYKIPFGNAFIYEKGKSEIELKVSNAYLSVPITAQFAISRKLEINVGIYAGFLIGPTGSGTLFFESSDHPKDVFFKQSLIHNYYSDNARGAASNALGSAIIVDGRVVDLVKDAGAYYNYLESEKVGSAYNLMDYGLTGGFSYFLNKGFYVGFRYDFGLADITKNTMDPSKKTFNTTDNKLIFNNEKDTHIGFQASFGFRF